MNTTMAVMHHGGDAHCGMHALIGESPAQPAIGPGEQEGADDAHGAGLGRRRQAQKNRAEHDEDEEDRGHHAARAAPSQIPAAQCTRLRGQGRHVARAKKAQDEHPQAEEQNLNEARAEGAAIHVTHRLLQLIGENDENQRGRNELGYGARGGNDAGCMANVVAIFHHHRQGDEPHGDDRGRDSAGDGTKNRADEDHGIGETAAQSAEKLAEAFEQILREAAALQNGAHQGEEGNGEQQLIGQNGKELEGEIAEEIGGDETELDADEAEEQPHRSQRKGGGIADDHKEDEPRKHEGRHIFASQFDHCTGLS
jgi:hypothetical protein